MTPTADDEGSQHGGAHKMDDVRALLDHREIVDVTYRYGAALDARDWQLLRSCFLAEATADFGVWGKAKGVEEIVEAARPVMEGMDRTQHVMTNHVTTIRGDNAEATCYLVAEHLLLTATGSTTSTTRGVYHDRLVRTSAGWRIASRQLDVTWREGNTGIFEEALRRPTRTK